MFKLFSDEFDLVLLFYLIGANSLRSDIKNVVHLHCYLPRIVDLRTVSLYCHIKISCHLINLFNSILIFEDFIRY